MTEHATQHQPVPRGRGAGENPAGRFERLRQEWSAETDGQLKTELYRDPSRSIVTVNDSPDIGVEATLNPYRGCEHGCIYCYARPTHEYLGLSAGLDFESKIFVKTDAPELLRQALAAKSWQPKVISMSGVTDPYQPVERRLELSRRCLEVLLEFRNPVTIITKNHLVTRDIDLLAALAAHRAAQVFVSITTLDGELARVMEPRASRPGKRLEAIRELRRAGIPAGVMMAPILPGLTDHEIPAVLKEAAAAGAEWAGYTMLRLPYGVKDLFQHWLETHYPLRKDKVLNRIREMRGGKLNESGFGKRMRGEGEHAEMIARLFRHSRARFGLDYGMVPLSTDSFRRVTERQMSLW